MSRDEIYLKLTSVFHEVFDNEDITLSDGMSAEDVDEWDSLSHIRLVVAVEEMFSPFSFFCLFVGYGPL